MTANIPVFSKRDNEIKRAIVTWLERAFAKSGKKSNQIQFKQGDLEDGVREILSKPELTSASIRTHITNLRTDKLINVDDENTFQSSKHNGRGAKPKQDSCFTITKIQLDRLHYYVANWDKKRPREISR